MRIRPTHLVLLPLLAAVPASVAVVALGQLAGPAAAEAPTASPSVAAAASATTASERATALRPVGRPDARPSKAPAAKPAVKPAGKPAVKAAVKPAAKPVAPPVSKPVSKPAATSTTSTKPAPRPTASSPAPKPAATAVPQGRDDYPWRTATTNDHDDWGFTKRQCVSFAAFRLAQAGRALDNATEGWGSAKTWDDVARQRGRTVSSTPVVGSVAHWDAGEASAYYGAGSTTANGRYTAGPYGHVGWVTHVYSDGSVQVEAYNGSGDRSWSSMHVKAPRYLRL